MKLHLLRFLVKSKKGEFDKIKKEILLSQKH